MEGCIREFGLTCSTPFADIILCRSNAFHFTLKQSSQLSATPPRAFTASLLRTYSSGLQRSIRSEHASARTAMSCSKSYITNSTCTRLEWVPPSLLACAFLQILLSPLHPLTPEGCGTYGVLEGELPPRLLGVDYLS